MTEVTFDPNACKSVFRDKLAKLQRELVAHWDKHYPKSLTVPPEDVSIQYDFDYSNLWTVRLPKFVYRKEGFSSNALKCAVCAWRQDFRVKEHKRGQLMDVGVDKCTHTEGYAKTRIDNISGDIAAYAKKQLMYQCRNMIDIKTSADVTPELIAAVEAQNGDGTFEMDMVQWLLLFSYFPSEIDSPIVKYVLPKGY